MSSASATSQDIWLLALHPFTGDYPAGDSNRFAANMMVDMVNNDEQLLPGYRLRILHQDSRCDGLRAEDVLLHNLLNEVYYKYPDPPHVDVNGDGHVSEGETLDLVQVLRGEQVHPRPIGIIGAGCSRATMAIVKLAHAFRVHQISAISTFPALSDRQRFPHFFRPISHDGFSPGAMCSLARTLGLQRLTPVVGSLSDWVSHLPPLVEAAQSHNISLLGSDLSEVVYGLSGVLFSTPSLPAAREAILDIRRMGARVVPTFMYSVQHHALLCAQALSDLRAVVWFGMIWDGNIWGGKKPFCGREEVLGSLSGVMQFVPSVWRTSLDQQLTCARNMTAGDFRREYFRKQGVPLGEMSVRALGNYYLHTESPATADVVCMYALMLRELLILQRWPLEKLATRSEAAYLAGYDALSRSRFQGVLGEAKFTPGRADSIAASVALHQVQTPSSPCTGLGGCGDPDAADLVELGTFLGGVFHFTQGARLLFHFPDEAYALPLSPQAQLQDFRSCPDGQMYEPHTRNCSSCGAGMVFVGDLGGCTCAPGQRKSNSSCVPCALGRFSSQVSTSQCDPCPTGHFGDQPGQRECAACAVGTFSEQPGATACSRCSSHRPQPQPQPGLWTTMREVRTEDGGREWTYAEGSNSRQACGCDRGARMDTTGACVPCGEGLRCGGMKHVGIEPGYYSNADISVYKCHGSAKRCVGGTPGRTCNEGRHGIACADCAAGKSPASDGTCQPCSGTDTGPAVLICLVGIGIICTWYSLLSDPTGSMNSSRLACTISFGQLLTAAQILNMIARVPATWEEPMETGMQFFSIFYFNIDIFRMQCIGSFSPLARFVMSLTVILVVLALVVVIHVFSVIVWHKSKFRSRHHALKCTLGAILMAFYISVVSSVLSPLQCDQHPNEKWTVHRYEGVTCWESSEHTIMVVSGVLALLLIPIPLMIHCAFIVVQFPRRMRTADVDFLHNYGFLFFRSRPEAYWHILLHLARNLFVACVAVLPGAALQLLVLQVLMSASLALAVHYKPWRSDAANVLEAIVMYLLLFLCILASFFGEVSVRELHVMAYFCMVLLVAVITPLPLLMLRHQVRRWVKGGSHYQFFLCHHKAGAGAFTRLLKMSMLESPKVTKDIFIDTDDLENVTLLFEVVREYTDTLVIIASRNIFTRTWCIGEMTTARLSNTKAIVVAMPDTEMPSESTVLHFTQNVQDLTCLTAENISVRDIEETLHWCLELPRFAVPLPFGKSAVTELSAKLCGAKPRVTASPESTKSKAFILCDQSDLEAVSAACVLHRMLVKRIQQPWKLPIPLHGDEELPEGAETLIVMLSSGFLDQPYCLNRLLNAARGSVKMLPVLLHETFRFPLPKDLEEMEAIGEDVTDVVQKLLCEISVNFHPGSMRLSALEAAAGEVTDRVTRGRMKKVGTQHFGAKESVEKVLRQSVELLIEGPLVPLAELGQKEPELQTE